MNIISWNANRTDRYTRLWGDVEVSGRTWDIISLQEAGAPDPAWTAEIGNNAWVGDRDTDESIVVRRYTYTPPNQAIVYITHGEWPNRQKNHNVIITKMRPTVAFDMSGQMADRPTLAIKVRLVWPQAWCDVMVGAVHSVASSKSDVELGQCIKFYDEAAKQLNCVSWLVVGDFNCDPMRMGSFNSVIVKPPNFPTHDGGQTLDYIVARSDYFFQCDRDRWVQGTAKSDHTLAHYKQDDGPTVQIL
jgi:hypothetical protein